MPRLVEARYKNVQAEDRLRRALPLDLTRTRARGDQAGRATAPRRQRRVDAGHREAPVPQRLAAPTIRPTSSSRSSSTTSRPCGVARIAAPCRSRSTRVSLYAAGTSANRRAQAADVILLDPHEAGGALGNGEGRGDRRVGRHSGHAAQRRRARAVAGRVSASGREHSRSHAGDRRRARRISPTTSRPPRSSIDRGTLTVPEGTGTQHALDHAKVGTLPRRRHQVVRTSIRSGRADFGQARVLTIEPQRTLHACAANAG